MLVCNIHICVYPNNMFILKQIIYEEHWVLWYRVKVLENLPVRSLSLSLSLSLSPNHHRYLVISFNVYVFLSRTNISLLAMILYMFILELRVRLDLFITTYVLRFVTYIFCYIGELRSRVCYLVNAYNGENVMPVLK